MMDFEAYINEPLSFQEEILRLFDQNKSLNVFDIGACEGEDSIRLKRLLPKANIHSFEPLPRNVKKIKANFMKYSINNAEVLQLALSDKNGMSEFYVSSGQPKHLPRVKGWDYGNKSSSLLAPKEHKNTHKWVKFNKKIKVRTQRLDFYCERTGINKIDFAYIDVQGAELMVLKGAGKMIKNIGAVWMEVEAVELYDKQPLKNDVEKFMKQHGFICVKDTVNEVSGDQLYINKRFSRKQKVKAVIGRVMRKQTIIVRKLRLRRRELVKLEDGIRMLLPDDMAWAFSNGKYYEHNVIYWLDRIIKLQRQPVFYDIGANYGYYSLKLSSNAKQVYALEPVLSTYKVLSYNVRANRFKNIRPYRIAIGETSGNQEINLYNSSGNNSIFNRNIPANHPLKKIGKEVIRVVGLSEFINNTKALPPTIIKIDVEGGELEVLRSSTKIIKNYMPSIIIEYSETTSRDAGYSRSEILKYLKNIGYKIYGLSSVNDDLVLYSPSTKHVQIANLIAVRPSIKLES